MAKKQRSDLEVELRVAERMLDTNRRMLHYVETKEPSYMRNGPEGETVRKQELESWTKKVQESKRKILRIKSAMGIEVV